MRPIIMLIFSLTAIGGLFGQSEKGEKISGSATKHIIKPKGSLSETRLVLSGFTSDIIIEGSNRTDIEISTENYERKPERAEGLKSLSDMATENTQIGLSFEFKGSEIHLMPASTRAQDADYLFKVPNSIKLKVSGNSFNSNDIFVEGMSNEIELSTQSGDILIDKVTGPIVAKTISGDIEIGFNSLNQKLPSSLNTISGDIDITMSAADKGSFSISSISGEVFTDLDLKVKKTGKSVNDIDVDIEIENNLNNDVNVDVDVDREVQRAQREVQRAMRETDRAMKEVERTVNEEVRRSLHSAPDVPDPPQIPFHFNWATPSGIGSKFQAELNGGGVSFAISSISGDVFLRKSEK